MNVIVSRVTRVTFVLPPLYKSLVVNGKSRQKIKKELILVSHKLKGNRVGEK